MSLPIAQKDISDKPAKGSVTDPVDKTAQAADIDRKLRFYGIVNAFQQSRMPTNQQIDSWLSYALSHSPTLVHDTREVLDTLRALVQEKNADELLQKFVWHTRAVDTAAAKKDPSDVLPVDNDKVRGDAQTATQHLRTLLSLVLTNGEAAEQTRPNEERLRGVDEPAPDNQFVSEGGRRVGHDETPVPEVRVPGTDARVAQHPREEFAHGATVKQGNGEVKSGGEFWTRLSRRRTNCKTGHVRRGKEDVQQQLSSDAPDEEDASGTQHGWRSKMSGMKDSLTGRVPPEHKDRANEHFNRAKNFLSDEYFPQERRDQLLFRGKKVVIECQNHKDYQESIRWLLDSLEEYSKHGRTIAGQGKWPYMEGIAPATHIRPSLQEATSELRTLLERFANGMSLDVIGDTMHALYEDAQRDEDLRNWFRDIDSFSRDVLLQPGYVLDDQCNDRANQLRESGSQFYDEKYKGHFDNFFTSLTDWLGAIADDPLNKRFGNDWARLAKDLLFDSEGSLKYKPELWSDIRKVIMPSLVDHIGHVPIPRIEYTDDSLDLVIENLALSGRNLLPNAISMEARNFIKFSPYDSLRDQQHHEFTLTFSQIQADMRDVAFSYRKKSGMPKLADAGVADVLLGGAGMTVAAHVASVENDRRTVFRVQDVHVAVDTLKFAIRDSKHDVLYKTLLPLVQGLVKKQLQKAVGGAVATALEYVDGQLVAVRDQMAEAKAGDERGRTQVLREHLAARKDEAGAKKDQKNAQFKVVAQPGKELMPDRGHPAGWVGKTGERAKLATQGEEWRSEAFNVV
ncbi:hypothetical protein B0H21DRAFT_863006 [Amylocystis lapponica]|nr:hypothetical protein B0H21DRAFT_863006 [Amylocystis lapponica]